MLCCPYRVTACVGGPGACLRRRGARTFRDTRKAILGSATPRKSLSFRSGCRRSLAPPQRKRETSKIRGICRICFGILKFVEFAGFVGFVVAARGNDDILSGKIVNIVASHFQVYVCAPRGKPRTTKESTIFPNITPFALPLISGCHTVWGCFVNFSRSRKQSKSSKKPETSKKIAKARRFLARAFANFPKFRVSCLICFAS